MLQYRLLCDRQTTGTHAMHEMQMRAITKACAHGCELDECETLSHTDGRTDTDTRIYISQSRHERYTGFKLILTRFN